MVPAWALLLALLVGVLAGWFARVRLEPSQRRTPTRHASVELVAPENESGQKIDAVLEELERRYQGRVEDVPPPRARPVRRSPRGGGTKKPG